MAPEAGRGESARQEQESMAVQAALRGGGLVGFFTSRMLGVFVVVLLLLQGAAFAYYFVIHQNRADLNTEISLGPYHFEANPAERSQILGASFSLYVAPLPEADREARTRLAQRRNRVQQDIEELLRLAHGGDFVDPTLGELKRQIQERINKTLEMRAVADVIITGLELQRRVENEPKPKTEPPTASSWPPVPPR